MRFVSMLCAIAFPVIASGALPAADQVRFCMIAPMRGPWTPVATHVTRPYVQEFLNKADLKVAEMLMCESNQRWGVDPVWVGLIRREKSKGKIFVIGMSNNFATTQREHLRAWAAHEVAHLVAKTPGSACEAVFHYHSRKDEDHTRCEHDVDRIAMRWVGKLAMLAALRGLLSFSEFEQRDTRVPTPEAILDLQKRILLLEKVSE